MNESAEDESGDDHCPDCGYAATDRVDAFVHVVTQHEEGLSNV